MQINRITLRDFRAVDWVDISPAAPGVTIVEGENEVGKTSVAEALDLILTTRDDSKKAAVKAIQPVGRDVGPEVSVDLTCGPYRFTYTKRWLRKQATTLEIHSPSPAQLTGREAHEKVESILAEHVDTGLWDAMRLQQGEPHQPDYAASSLGRALDRSAGGDRTTEGEDHLWARIVAERNKYWTATGKPTRSRGEVQEAVETAEQAVKVIEADLHDLNAQVDEVARLRAEATRLTAVQQQLEDEALELDGRHQRVTELRRQVEQLQAKRDAEVAGHEKWTNLAEARQRLVADVDDKRRALVEHRQGLEEGAAARALAEQREREATTARDEATEAVRTLEDAHNLAVADSDFRRWEIELAQLTERRDRVVEAQAQLSEAEATLESNRIGSTEVNSIEAAHMALAEARAAASSGAASLRAEALETVALTVDGRTVSLAAGDAHEVEVTASAEVTVPGVVRVIVQAGSEAKVLAERLDAARANLARRCHQHGVQDLTEARTRAQERSDAERIRREAADRIVADLRDLTLDSLTHKAERLRDRVAAYRSGRPSEPSLPTDLDAAQELAATLAGSLASARSDLTAREAKLDDARARFNAVGIDRARQTAQVEHDEQALSQAERTLASARDERDDETLEACLITAGERRRAAEQEHAAATERLAKENPGTLEVLVANARQARDRGADELVENRDRRRELEAVLKDRGEQGLAHRRDQACTERDRLRMERDRLEARADAALLLHDTFAARRSEARSRYVAPFRNRIEELGQIIFGPTLSVGLDEDLQIESRTLDGITVPYDQLSTGAREQLSIVSRLACALTVADDGGVPVILDDALGWTDPGRLTQMGAVIGYVGRTSQVVVLTCTPGRYAGVGAASIVRMPHGGGPVLGDGDRTEASGS